MPVDFGLLPQNSDFTQDPAGGFAGRPALEELPGPACAPDFS